MKKIINTKKAPEAIGPYNQAILSKNTLYCSGQIAINPSSGKLENANIKEEVKRIMSNIPVGKVRYIKFKGASIKLSKPISPTACFFAKSKSVVIPAIPNFWTEK